MAGDTLLRLPQVKARTGLSRSTIYLRIAQGSFPRPVRLGGARAVGWVSLMPAFARPGHRLTADADGPRFSTSGLVQTPR